MGKITPARLRAGSIVAAAAIVLSSFLVASPAMADSAPVDPADPTTPTTVTTDALPTPQIDGVVWSQKVIGNTVYVGGNFTKAQPAGAAAGVGTVSRTMLLSYNLTTGALNTGFAPVIDAQVKTIEASPDGTRLYIGGTFKTVNGVSRSRLAALNPTTGAVIANWNPNPNYTVAAIVASSTTVWFGGGFTGVGSATRSRVAAVSATTGSVLPFAPTTDGGNVAALALSPDGTKVIVGGSFTSLNGSANPGYGLGAVDSTSGALLPWAVNGLIRNGGANAGITALTGDASGVYGSGYTFGAGGNLEGSFRADWATGSLNWVEDCHGDTYSIAITDNAEYVAGHPHYCGNVGGFPQTSPTWTFQRGMAFGKTATQTVTNDPYGYYNYAGNPAPSVLNWFPDFNVGTFTGQSQGPWSVATSADSKYVLYGGEFTTVNGARQQGLVRFAVSSIAPNKRGPAVSATDFAPKVVSLSSGTARVSWTANYDNDNSKLTYQVFRNGNLTTPIYTTTQSSNFYTRPAMGFVDTGLTPGASVRYQIRATDSFGNALTSISTSTTVTASNPSAYASTVLSQGANAFWRYGEATGSDVYDWAGYSDQLASSGVSRGAAGATVDGDKASTFDGTADGLSSTQTSVQGPQTFSVEAWFKTTTTAGGKIVGFGDQKTGTSSNYDRHIYMNPDGTVTFGVYNGNTQTLSSPSRLNDGTWHQVIGSLSSAGMQFFVDGKRVGTRTDTTSAQVYKGYWRVGGDSSWNGAAFFAGSIDDVSVYPTALTRQQVASQYVAAGYTSPLASAPADSYGTQVFTDDPSLYFRLNDAAGSTTVADSSLTGTPGVISGGVTTGQTGALASTSDKAFAFDGSSGQVASSQSFYDPEVYTEEAWFKTTSTTGGKILGFGSERTGQSGSYDRHIYLQDDGRVVFGTYTGQLNTITTSGSFNDGTWHHVAATQSSDGLKLYLDGVLQGTNPATQAQPYTGYWKVGGDTTWGSSSAYFAGTIDEVAIYDRALPASTIAAHYSIGSGAGQNAPPVASFTSSSAALKASFDASGSIDSDGTVASYAWDFGDGTTGTGVSPTHTYAQSGTYTVTLTVTDNQGATGSSSAQVPVTKPANVLPSAGFTSSAVDLALSVDASSSSDTDGTIASYAWTFGDGGAGTGKTPSHTYTAGGTYSVTLTVTDNDGGTATSTSSVTVAAPRVNQAPVAAFTSSVTNLGLSVNGTSSTDSDGSVASYAWNFGDDTTASTATASHTYVAAGTYTVSLTVTDNEGAKGVLTRQITVAPPANVPPTASFTSGSNALALSVDASGSADSDGTISTYAWSFGDGSSATGKTAAHTFAAAGTYTVALTVTDNQGSSTSTSQSITVSRAPNVLPTSSFSLSATNLKVTVDGTTSSDPDGTIASYAWSFGDGATATTATASHTYATAGTYAVKLTVTDNDGGTASTTQSVTVQAAANVAPTASFTSAATGLALQVDGSGSADSDGTIASYAWTYGDGATDTGATAAHTYAAGGTYTVSLTVKDNGGASNTVSRDITVTEPVAAAFVLDSFSRTVANGFGAAETGGAYTNIGSAANLSVAGGAGILKLPTAGYQGGVSLNGVAKQNFDIRANYGLDKAATGGGTYIYTEARRMSSSTQYRSTVRFSSSNTAVLSLTAMVNGTSTALGNQVVMPGTVTAGAKISVRMQVSGTSPTTIRFKAWLTGTTEPTAWNITATDSSAALQAPGALAVEGYVSGSATNAPQTLQVSQLSAFAP